MGQSGAVHNKPGAARRPPRRPRNAPRPRRANGSVRINIVLHKLANETVEAEMQRRGLLASDTIGSIINEWRLLQGLAKAQEFRHATRNDLNAIVLNAEVAATSQGRTRDDALKVVRGRAADMNNRLPLVTML